MPLILTCDKVRMEIVPSQIYDYTDLECYDLNEDKGLEN